MGERKAIVVLVDAQDHAESVARLIGSTLMLNGYVTNSPAVIDWPEPTSDEDDMPPLRVTDFGREVPDNAR